MITYKTIIFCTYTSVETKGCFLAEVARSRAHLNLHIPYPLSGRKQSTFERGGTVGSGKNSAKQIEDSFADRASYTEGKIGICPMRKTQRFCILHSGRKGKVFCYSLETLFSVWLNGYLLNFLCMMLN